jgi:hypothetical protein
MKLYSLSHVSKQHEERPTCTYTMMSTESNSMACRRAYSVDTPVILSAAKSTKRVNHHYGVFRETHNHNGHPEAEGQWTAAPP